MHDGCNMERQAAAVMRRIQVSAVNEEGSCGCRKAASPADLEHYREGEEGEQPAEGAGVLTCSQSSCAWLRCNQARYPHTPANLQSSAAC